jgi:hypothetical protein
MPSSAASASGGSFSSAAARFSRKCATDGVPGMSRTFAARCRSHASATCMGVISRRFATPDRAEDCSGVKPPSGKNGTGLFLYYPGFFTTPGSLLPRVLYYPGFFTTPGSLLPWATPGAVATTCVHRLHQGIAGRPRLPSARPRRFRMASAPAPRRRTGSPARFSPRAPWSRRSPPD